MFRILASGSTLTAIALLYGGSHWTIGAIAAIPYIVRLSQLWSPMLIARWGATSVAFASAWLERTGWAGVGLIAVLHPAHTLFWLLAWYALAMLGTSCYDTATTASHSEVVPVIDRSLFSGFRQRWSGISGFLGGVFGGLVLDVLSRFDASKLTARVTLVALGVFASFFVFPFMLAFRRCAKAFWTEAPGPLLEPDASWRERLSHTVANPLRPLWQPTPDDRRLLRFALAWGASYGLLLRHTDAFALQQLHLRLSTLSMLNGLLVGGAVLGATTWGVLADRFGGRGVLGVTSGILALDPLWLVLAATVHPGFLIVSYALFGCANAGWAIALPTTLVRVEHSGLDRLRAFAAFQAVSGLASGLAPLVGAALLSTLSRVVSLGEFGAYLVLFVLALTLRLWARRGLHQIPSPPSASSQYIRRVLWRHTRLAALRRWRVMLVFDARHGAD